MRNQFQRPCDVFLDSPGCLLGDHGFMADPGHVQYGHNINSVKLYHYTHHRYLDRIMRDGLKAQLPVVMVDELPGLHGLHVVEALLEPLPQWMTNSPYFGNLGLELMRAYVGNVLLQITLPADVPGVYVADAAHNFECKHQKRRGSSALMLGYHCRTGHEVCQAEVNSYIPLENNNGGHVAPNAKITWNGVGVAVPAKYIEICDTQPLM